jgi:hypothetical protein
MARSSAGFSCHSPASVRPKEMTAKGMPAATTASPSTNAQFTPRQIRQAAYPCATPTSTMPIAMAPRKPATTSCTSLVMPSTAGSVTRPMTGRPSSTAAMAITMPPRTARSVAAATALGGRGPVATVSTGSGAAPASAAETGSVRSVGRPRSYRCIRRRIRRPATLR